MGRAGPIFAVGREFRAVHRVSGSVSRRFYRASAGKDAGKVAGVNRGTARGQPRYPRERREPMSERPEAKERDEHPRVAAAARGGISQLWLLLPYSIVVLSAGAALAHVFPAFRWESLPIVAAVIATGLFALLLNRLLLRAGPAAEAGPIGEGLRELLDSAGPAVVAIDLTGRLIYCNPATERLLGYHAAELLDLWGKAEHSCARRRERLVAEMQKLCHVDRRAGGHAGRPHDRVIWIACARCRPAWCPASTRRCAARMARSCR